MNQDLAAFQHRLGTLCKDGDISKVWQPEAHWWGSHPLNQRQGHGEIADVWQQLRQAMPDVERRDSIFIGGTSKPDDRMPPALAGRNLVASMGTYQGTFRHDLLGIPATHGLVHLRFSEVHHLDDDGMVQHSYCLWDFLDLMRQAGVWPIMPSLGAEHMWPAPASNDGVKLAPTTTSAAHGQTSFDTVMKMHGALLSFDGHDLDSMDHAAYWTDNFLWYGPSGIGSTRGMSGFRAHHQIPFLIGFPDRAGAGHYVRIADENIVVTGGWPSVVATHRGEWLGIPATGQRIDMRVMDFYRLTDGNQIAENWVPIDVIHMLLQMGVDVFARMRHSLGQHPSNLPKGYGE